MTDINYLAILKEKLERLKVAVDRMEKEREHERGADHKVKLVELKKQKLLIKEQIQRLKTEAAD